MKKVTNFVQSDVISEASKWLLSRKNGKGGFKQSSYQWGGASDNTNNAYIVWALTSAGYTDLLDEVDALMTEADT